MVWMSPVLENHRYQGYIQLHKLIQYPLELLTVPLGKKANPYHIVWGAEG